jgi:zinc protease
MRKLISFLSLPAVGLLALSPIRGSAQTGSSAASVPQVNFTEYRLANGLRVILAPDRSAPVIATSITYNVGSRNERPGRTGFAHLFEHLMFQGSENVGRGEHFVLINDNGGSFNGTTNQDRTNYFATLPANQLDLALYLEADRMRALDINPENLNNQRLVVQEERRQSYDNQPYGALFETVLDLSYSNFAYKHSTIGSMADLNAATLDDVRAFFKTYYAPNNATLAVVGDFNAADAKAKIQKYFGAISRQPAPPPVDVTEPPPSGERRKTIEDPLARLPRYAAAYRTVPGNSPDYCALNLLAGILGRGRTSRLYSAVTEKRLALNATASESESRGEGLFMVNANLTPQGDVDAVEAAIDAEIARIQNEGVTEAELNRAKTQARLGTITRLQTALGKANQLSSNAVFFDDPNRVNTLLPSLQAVTAADVRRVARKYLVPRNRVVVIGRPAPSLGSASGASPGATSRQGASTQP